MTIIVATPPAVEPLSVEEARARLNIGDELSDAVVGALITAARQMIDGPEGWLGRAINTQTLDLVLDRFPDENYYYRERGFYPDESYRLPELSSVYPSYHRITIPLPPLQDVVSVSYTDVDGNPQTFAPSNFIVSKGAPSFLSLAIGATWPSSGLVAGAAVVRFKAGYGDAGSDVPETIRMAIALQVSHLRSLMAQNLFLSGEEVIGVGRQNWTLSSNAGDVIDAATKALLQQYRVWTYP